MNKLQQLRHGLTADKTRQQGLAHWPEVLALVENIKNQRGEEGLQYNRLPVIILELKHEEAWQAEGGDSQDYFLALCCDSWLKGEVYGVTERAEYRN